MASSTVPEAVYADIGRTIERWRLARRLSQRDLGLRLQHPLTRAAISNMESGRQRVHIHVLIDIATALDVALSEFLPRTNNAMVMTIEDEMVAGGMEPGVSASLAARLADLSRDT